MKTKSDGSSADYYKLPEGATELQDLISHRNMNAQIGEILRACYRYGRASHSDTLRDAKKILFYAQAEVKRLETVAMSPVPEGHADKKEPDYTDGEWHDWHGGRCPVPPETMVEISTPRTPFVAGQMAGSLRWGRIGEPDDIIKFRVVK
jgi:hypothetical protein